MTSQDQRSDLWQQNLERDERVVWSGATSDELRLKEIGRKRSTALALLVVGLAVGWMLVWNLAHPPRDTYSGLGSGGWPIIDIWRVPQYLLGICVCGAVVVFSTLRLFSKALPEQVYALTSTRLLACDSQGAILHQLSVGEIAELRWKVGIVSPVVEVRRKHDPKGREPLVIRNVADIAGLEKAIMSWRSAV